MFNIFSGESFFFANWPFWIFGALNIQFILTKATKNYAKKYTFEPSVDQNLFIIVSVYLHSECDSFDGLSKQSIDLVTVKIGVQEFCDVLPSIWLVFASLFAYLFLSFFTPNKGVWFKSTSSLFISLSSTTKQGVFSNNVGVMFCERLKFWKLFVVSDINEELRIDEVCEFLDWIDLFDRFGDVVSRYLLTRGEKDGGRGVGMERLRSSNGDF